MTDDDLALMRLVDTVVGTVPTTVLIAGDDADAKSLLAILIGVATRTAWRSYRRRDSSRRE